MSNEPDRLGQQETSLVRDKRMWLSMGASIVAFVINFALSFFLTPYLIENLGEAEYSFYPLASSLVNYITIATVALNSMASRFVTVSRHRGEEEKAKTYFASTFYSNLILSLILLPIAGLFIWKIDWFIVVPAEIRGNVQTLFALVFLCLLVGQIGTVFNIAPYCCDRLYLSRLAEVVSRVVMVLAAVILFSLLPANVYYVGIINLISAAVLLSFHYFFTRRLMPDMQISKRYFSGKHIRELIGSGIWNSVSQLSNVLLNGLDLLIANRYLGPEATAAVSVSKVVPSNLAGLISTIGNVFHPRFARQFAHEDKKAFVESVSSSIRLMGLIFCLPIGFLISCGESFFGLWVPTMDARLLQILSIMGMGVLFISASLDPVYGVFTVTNKIKTNSLVVLATGVLNIAIVLTLLQFVQDPTWRLFIIVGTSTLLGIARNLFFTITYTAICMGVRWNSFYKPLSVNVLLLLGGAVIYYAVRMLIPAESWLLLILNGVIGTVIAAAIGWFVVLKREERRAAIAFVREKLHRKGEHE